MMIRFSGGRVYSRKRLVSTFLLSTVSLLMSMNAGAVAPSPGGNIVATNPAGGATTITEDASAPGSANIRISPTTLTDGDMGETPDSIRLISITGGTVTQGGDGSMITLGASGTVLMLVGGNYDARFTPSSNRDTAATIQYVVVDPGNVADSAQSTITVNISAANDAPTASNGSLTTIVENSTNPAGASVSGLFGVGFMDVDTGSSFAGIAVVANTAASGDGKWQYSPVETSPPGGPGDTWLDVGAVSTASSLVLRTDALLRFLPAMGFDGAVTSISVRVLDNSYGGSFSNISMSSENRITLNTTTNGSPTAISAATNTIAHSVDSIPTVSTPISDVTANENAANTVISLLSHFADTEDGAAGLTYTVQSTTGDALFAATFPSIAGSNLTLDYEANTTGTAMVTIRATDSSGSTVNDTFQVTVNGGPTVSTPISNVSVNENAANTVISLLTHFADTESGAAGLTYTVNSTTGDPLFASSFPSISGSTLTLDYEANTPGTAMVTIRATDPGGLFVQDTFQVDVNDTPTVPTPISDVQVNENAANTVINLLSSFDDAEDGAAGLTYTVQSTTGDSVFAATFPSISGSTLTLDYASNASGTAMVTIRATDTGGAFISDTFRVDVNDAPTVSSPISDVAVNENAANTVISLLTHFADAEDGAAGLTYTVQSTTGAAIFAATFPSTSGSTLTLSYAANTPGSANVTIRATDSQGLFIDDTFQVVVNDTPTVSAPISDVQVNENAANTSINLLSHFTDAEDGSGGLTYTVDSTSGDAVFAATFPSISGSTLTLDYQTNAAGTAMVTIRATDSGGAFIQDTFQVDVNDTPTVPTPIADVQVNENAANTVISLLANFADAEDGAAGLTYTINSTTGNAIFAPTFPSISGSNLTLDYAANTSGTAMITIRATDTGGLFIDDTFQVTINDTPTLSSAISDVQVNENAPDTVISLLTHFADTEDGSGGLTYSVNSVTGTALFAATFPSVAGSNLTLRYAPNTPGIAMVTIRATDSGGSFVSDVFQVSVNDRPVAVANTNGTQEGTATTINVLGNDSDSDGTLDPASVTVSTAAGNGSTMVNTTTGEITYTPTGDFNGPDTFQYTVADNMGFTSAPALVTVNVSAVNDPPGLIVPGATQNVAEGDTLVISSGQGNPITVSDVDADETAFGGGAGGVRITLSAAKGTLTLASTANLANLSGNTTKTVAFDGTIADTAVALNGLVYTPDALVNGADTINVVVTDKGNTGSGAIVPAMGAIAVNITATNDPPVVTAPGSRTVSEDVLTVISGVSVADPDAGSGEITVTLSVAQGFISVNASAAGGVPSGQITNNGSSNVTLLGTVSQQNATLATLRFQTAQDLVSDQSLSIVANDNGLSGGPAETDSASIGISVTAQNDNPTFTIFPATPQSVNEDTILQFSTANGNRITISDIDHQENNPTGVVRATLAVSRGVLMLNGTTGLTNVSGNGTGTIVAEGSTANLNTALNGLRYQGSENVNGADLLTVTLNDLGNTGAGGGVNVSMNVTINVAQINDAPTITVPPTQMADENTNFPFSSTDNNEIVIADVDANEAPGEVIVTLAVNSGTLTMSDTVALSTITGNTTASVSMTGSIAATNAALESLLYLGNQNFNGIDTLTITANDQGNTGSGPTGTDSETVTIEVGAVNNAPVVTVPGAQTIIEDATTPITGIVVSDVDAGAGNLVVTLSVASGVLSVNSAVSGGVDALAIGNNNTSSVTLTGTLSKLNTTLPTLTFRTASNNASNQTLTVNVNDQGNTGDGGAASNQKTIALNITALNDNPQIVVPAAQSTNEEVPLIFSAATFNTISVSDVDVAESAGELRATLTVSHGRLTLATTTGLTFVTGTGSNEATMTISGTVSALNNALNGMSYTPDQDFNTEAGQTESLALIINDQGNTGQGGGVNVNASVSIAVAGVNDAPTLTLPGAQSVNEDTPLTFMGTIAVADIDVAESSGILRLTMASTKGTVTLAQTTGLTIVAPATGSADSTITFTGTVAAINSALNGLIYKGLQDVNGSDTITLTVNDLGNTGQGGGTNVVRTLAVTINPVNDAPVASTVLLSPAEPLRNEDLVASYVYTDVDTDPENNSAIRWFRNGELQSAFNNLLTVPMNTTVEEEEWFFRVTPNDGMLPGIQVQSNTVEIRPVADLQMFISRTPSQVVPGENVTYTFQARNLGPSPVTGTTISATLPSSLENVTWTCAACGSSGTGSLNETIDLASGETVEYALTALVNAAATGNLTVEGSNIGPAIVFETNAANNSATDTVALMPEANLSVTAVSDRDEAAPTETITYTITATNDGPSDARGVFFTDTPDVNSTLVAGSVSSSQGTIVDGNDAGDNLVTVNGGTLPLGESIEIRYSVTINAPFPASGIEMVCTRGEFFGEVGNPNVNFVNATAAQDVCTTVNTVIDFAATKIDTLRVDQNGDEAINPGDTVRYTVHLVNSGNGGANGVVYTQPAIANSSLIEDSVTVTPAAQNISLNSGSITIALGSIEGDNGINDGSNEATIHFDVVVVNPLPPGEDFLVTQGAITYDEIMDPSAPILTDDPDAVVFDGFDVIPVDEAGNVLHPAPTATRVIAAPVLVVLKSDDIPRTQVKRPGDTIVYTVTIENEGNRGAADLFYRTPFRDNEISTLELQQVDGGSPLVDVAQSLLTNFSALDTNDSLGLSAAELDGSFFALTSAQFAALDTSDARLNLLENSIFIDGNPATNVGSATELLLDLGTLNGRNPLFTNGPTITINFTVRLNNILLEGLNTILCQGSVESDSLAPVLSDDPETINTAFDATATFVRAVPDITIIPEILTIDFGDQDIDDGRTPARMVQISNSPSATANLTLGFVGLEGADLREFDLVSDTEEPVLAPGESRFIEVAFDPDSIGNKIGSLRIESDDPDDSAIDVNLSGRALDSNIRVTPSTLNFRKRNLLAGASAPQSVSIINDGLGILTLDSVTLACGPDIFPVMTQARFDELDLNGDGVLTTGIGRAELENAIDLFDVAEVFMEEFDALDTDGSDSLSTSETEVRFPFLSSARFDVLDGDLSGGLGQAELTQALDLADNANSLLTSFADFDTTPPEGLDFTEAQGILPDLTQAQFALLDADENGALGKDELREQISLAIIASRLSTDFTGLDLDQDKVLTLSEISTFTPLLTPGRFAAIDMDASDEITQVELSAVTSTLANDILSDFVALDEDSSGGLTLEELSATCDFEILSDSGEESLETAQSRLVRVVFNPSTPGMKVGTLRIEANQQGQGTPIVSKVTLFGTGNRTPRITNQNPVATKEDTPVVIILDNLIVDAPLLDFPEEVTLGFEPLPQGANFTRDGNRIIPNLNFNGVLFVPVTVRDGNIDSNVWQLRIDVAKVNDPPTSISLSNNTIAENQVLNTVIGQLRTTDPDLGDLHIYSLVPDDPTTDDDDFIDNEFFSIIANQLVSRVVFDFETRAEYTVMVRSRDPEGKTIERAFSVNVIDQPNDEDNSVASEVLLNDFDSIDSDGDGILTFEETQAVLPGFTADRFNQLNVESELSEAELQLAIDQTASAIDLFDRFELGDTNESGGLSILEARTQVPNLSEAAFNVLDQDRDGALTPSELQAAILFNGELSSILAAFNSLDIDASGQLTLDEIPRSFNTITLESFNGLERNPGISQRELQSQVTCMLIEDTLRLVQPTGDLLASPEATLLDVTFNAEIDVNIQSACDANDVLFTFDIGAESILITDLAEYFLRNFIALDANFDNGLTFDEVSFSRIGVTAERFNTIDFDGDTVLVEEELEAQVILSDLAATLLNDFATLNVDNSTGLSFAETQSAAIDFDTLRYGIVDLNNNGVLTRQELEAEIDLPAYLQENFTALDTNSDLGLTRLEIAVTLPGLSQTRFERIDADLDGFATPDELAVADDFGKRYPIFAQLLPKELAQKQLRGTDPATFTLPVNNAYRVKVTATLTSTGQVVESEDFTFEIRNGVDDNMNGYLDSPFSDLVNDSSRWHEVAESVNCDRAVVMHYWRGTNIPGHAIEVALPNPANDKQIFNLKAPHGLLNEGEEGLLIVAMACDGESLFTRQQAEDLDALPEDMVSGAPWLDVSVVVRTIGETEFTPLSDARLALRPVMLSLNRLSFSPEDQATFYQHTALVVDDPTTGFTVVPGLGTWSGSAGQEITRSGDTLRAAMTQLGIVVAVESLKPPILVTSPDRDAVIDMGEVTVSQTEERSIVISNNGGERLVGTVELRDATGTFFIIGEASYNLGHGETHTFIVRFSPLEATDYAASITYSGDVDGLITTAVTGVGIAPKTFGCSPSRSTPPLPLGNGLVITLMVLWLAGHQILQRRRA